MNKKERDERYSGGGEEKVFSAPVTHHHHYILRVFVTLSLVVSLGSSKSTTLKTLEKEYTPFAVKGDGRERGLTLHYKHKMMPAGLISIYFM